uniref:hypothetical protein n=1 Tax=Gordonia sp. B7-2 TaxID=3420932 RepID=UPI003D92BA7D
MNRIAAAAITTATLALMLTACSSDDNQSATTSTPALSSTSTPAAQTTMSALSMCSTSTARFEPTPELTAAAPPNPEVKIYGVQTTADHGRDTRTAIYYHLCAPTMTNTADLIAYGNQIVANVKRLPIAAKSKSVSLYNYVGNAQVGHIRCKAATLDETLVTMGACDWQTTW